MEPGSCHAAALDSDQGVAGGAPRPLSTHRRQWSRASLAAAAAIALAAGWVLAVGMPSPELPGLDYDETLFVPAALGGHGPFVRGVLGLPLWLMPYIGALKAWLFAPVFALFGFSPAAVRWPCVVLAAVTAALAGMLGWRMFGRAAGVAMAWLVATDPALVVMCRTDYGPVALAMVLKVVALLAVFAWLRSGSARVLVVAVVAMGLGLFHKLDFLWFVLAIGAATTLLWWGAVRAHLRRPAARRALVVLLLVTVAAALASLRASANLPPSLSDQAALAVRVPLVLRSCLETLDGRSPIALVLAQWPADLRRTAIAPVLAVAVTVLAWLALRWRTCSAGVREATRIGGFALLAAIGILVIATLTPGPRSLHHFMMLHPLHFLAVAGAAVALVRAASERWRRLVVTAVSLVGALLVVSQARITADYPRLLRQGEFAMRWSPAIYRLAGVAATLPVDTIVGTDWGLHNQLYGLADPGTRTRYVDGWVSLRRAHQGGGAAMDALRAELVGGRRAAVVMHVAEHEVVPDSRAAALELIAPLHRVGEPRVVTDVAGHALYEIVIVDAR